VSTSAINEEKIERARMLLQPKHYSPRTGSPWRRFQSIPGGKNRPAADDEHRSFFEGGQDPSRLLQLYPRARWAAIDQNRANFFPVSRGGRFGRRRSADGW
jgi:hypothetical protein